MDPERVAKWVEIKRRSQGEACAERAHASMQCGTAVPAPRDVGVGTIFKVTRPCGDRQTECIGAEVGIPERGGGIWLWHVYLRSLIAPAKQRPRTCGACVLP